MIFVFFDGVTDVFAILFFFFSRSLSFSLFSTALEAALTSPNLFFGVDFCASDAEDENPEE
jgi:hypothetical protein